MLIAAIGNAAITIGEINYPDSVKAGEDFYANVSYYCTTNDSVAVFEWEYSSPDYNAFCYWDAGISVCFAQFQKVAPDIYGQNLSFNISVWGINESVTQTEKVYAQDVMLVLASENTSATKNLSASGNLTWEDGTSISGKQVIIDFGELEIKTATTDSNGKFSKQITVPELVISSSYNITASVNNPIQKETSETVYIFGRTSGYIDFSPSYLIITDLGSEEQNRTIDALFNYSGNDPNNFTMTLSIFGEEYVTNQTSHSFVFPVSEGSGDYEGLITADWINDDNSTGIKSIVVPIYIESSFNISVTHNITEVNTTVDSSFELMVQVKSEGNDDVKLIYSVSGNIPQTWFSIIGNETIVSGAEENVTFNFVIPYAATAGTYEGHVVITTPSDVMKIPITVNVNGPEFKFNPIEPEYIIESEPKISIKLNLKNTGEMTARNISFSIECPGGWDCTVDKEKLGELKSGATFTLNANVLVKSPESVADKTITVTAEDTGKRTTSASTKILVRADSTKLVSDPIMVFNLIDPRFSKSDYYFVNESKLIPSHSLNVTGVSGRVQRDSSLSTWIVKLGDGSEGIGDICDVSLIVNGVKYDIDNTTSRTTGQALTGEVGSIVYEVYQFHKLGECVANLDYGDGKETITHIITSGEPPEQKIEFTKDEIEGYLKGVDEERKKEHDLEINVIVGAICLAALIFLLAVVYNDKIKGHFYKGKHMNDIHQFKKEIDNLREEDANAKVEDNQFYK